MDPLAQARQQLLLRALDPNQREGMEHAELYQARAGAPAELQNLLAGPEHRAYARETVASDPLSAPAIALSTLMYQPWKMLRGNARSDASLSQVAEGMAGIGEGLTEFARTKAQVVQDLIKKL